MTDAGGHSMSDDRDPSQSDGSISSQSDGPISEAASEPVIAPAAYDPEASMPPSSHGVPLAPSLSGTPDAPSHPQGVPAHPQMPGYPHAPASAPLPPTGYANPGYGDPGRPGPYGANPGYAHPGYPTPTPYGANPGYPASAPPAASGSNKTLWIVLGSVAAVIVIAIVGLVTAFEMLLRAASEPVALPSGIPSPSAAPWDEPDDDEDNPFETQRDDGIDAAAGEELAQLLDDTKAKYLELRDSGELWQQIPDTEFNRTALSAFLFFVADMKAATIWGITAEQAEEYEQRVAMLEERLLAQQPLGEDIRLTTDDGVFTYDGETGEGGWAEG